MKMFTDDKFFIVLLMFILNPLLGVLVYFWIEDEDGEDEEEES